MAATHPPNSYSPLEDLPGSLDEVGGRGEEDQTNTEQSHHSKNGCNIRALAWRAKLSFDVNAILEPWRRDSTSALMSVPYWRRVVEIQFQLQCQSQLQLRCQCHIKGLWWRLNFNFSVNAILELWGGEPTSASMSMPYWGLGVGIQPQLPCQCHIGGFW